MVYLKPLWLQDFRNFQEIDLPLPEGQPVIDDCWKGIGIRIEDDVLVTDNAPDVLTSNALKLLSDMEK